MTILFVTAGWIATVIGFAYLYERIKCAEQQGDNAHLDKLETDVTEIEILARETASKVAILHGERFP